MSVSRLIVDGMIMGSQSLKDKRRVIHSIRDRIGRIRNLAVAEVDGQDKWQRTSLLFVAAGSNVIRNRQALQQVIEILDSDGQIQILDTAVEDLE